MTSIAIVQRDKQRACASVGSTSPDPVSRKLYSLRKVPSRKKSLLQRICEVEPESSIKLWERWKLWDGFAILSNIRVHFARRSSFSVRRFING